MTATGAFARRLCRWAVLAAPHDRRDWAEAMAREVDEVDDDRAALGWAFGCFSACFVERMKSMRTLMIAVRLALAGACALFAAGTALPAAMIMASRAGWTPGLEALDGATAGDDYRRLATLLENAPDWLLGSGLIAIALYLVAGVLIVLRRAIAPWVFAAVVVLAGATLAITHSGTLFEGVFSPAELRTDYVGLALKTVVAAAMFWAVRRRDERPIV